MKKGLKIGLIVGGSLLVAGGAWAGLTKAGVIPNWLEIGILQEFNPVNIYLADEFDQDYLLNTNEVTCRKMSSYNYECCNKKNDFCRMYTDYPDGVYKPMIYLYPTVETEVNVKLGIPENLSHTYPKYNSERGWNVIAQPNGNLEDMDTGRKLYALYREGKSNTETNFDEGFVVAGKDIVPFLEEKLATLGLNEREAEEFIVYWLPQMEGNKYNLIRFETIEEQNENMLLNIIPTPDTVIRVMMDWKVIDELIDIPEQQLTTPERKGFTVVERGGSPRI